MISRRGFGAGLGALGLQLSWWGSAGATTAIGVSLEELVAESARVVLGEPVGAESSWELVAGTRRIVTTTRVLQHEDWLADSTESDELLVLTLGGRIGDLAQKVPGEATLRQGELCLLFVARETELRRRVIAMGQGHYPIEQGKTARVLRTSPSLPHLVGKPVAPAAPPQKQRAVDALSGLSLTDARALIQGAR